MAFVDTYGKSELFSTDGNAYGNASQSDALEIGFLAVKGGAYGKEIRLSEDLSYIHLRKPNSNGNNVVLIKKLKNGQTKLSEYSISGDYDNLQNVLQKIVYAHKRSHSRRSKMSGGTTDKWIAGALKKTHKGSFSAEAKRSGMSTQAFACRVLRSRSNSITRRRAQMFVNMNKNRKC